MSAVPADLVIDLEQLPVVLSPHQVCQVLQISLPTFYDMCREGRLASFRCARAIRVSRIALERFIHQSLGPQAAGEE